MHLHVHCAHGINGGFSHVLNHLFSIAIMYAGLKRNKRVHRLGNFNLAQNLAIDEGVNKVCYIQTSRL